MFSQSKTLSYDSPANVRIWLGMAFQAGAINAGALLSCHKFVTHTTGFATTFGTEAAKGNFSTGLSLLSIPLFFMVGAMTSAFFIDRRIQTDRRPLYVVVTGLMFFILLAVFVGGVAGRFGTFGADVDPLRHYILLISLALASGLQNATVTSAFGAVIRTTHMTGLTTDLGIGLMRVLTHSHKINSRKNEVHANLMRLSLFSSFAMGGFFSAYFYLRIQYWGFIIPTALAFILFAWNLYLTYHRSKSTTGTEVPT